MTQCSSASAFQVLFFGLAIPLSLGLGQISQCQETLGKPNILASRGISLHRLFKLELGTLGTLTVRSIGRNYQLNLSNKFMGVFIAW